MMPLSAQALTGLMALLLLAGSPSGGNPTVLVAGAIIDGLGEGPNGYTVVVIEGDRITAVGDRTIIPDEARIVDLGGATLLPGFIDAHVHPLIATDDYQVDHLRLSSAAKALRGLSVVQSLLAQGWTSIRIAGDADVYYAHLDLKRAIDAGLFTGPRISGAGHYLSVTGGGGDINFIAPEQQVVADGLIVDGVDEIRKAVRQEIKNGSDWIKVLATGAFMSAGDNPQQVHFSPEEMRAVVEEAARRGVPVMAHAHSAEGIRMSVEAGVRSVEHGTFIDDEGIDLMLERGTWLIPTLYIGEYYLQEHADSEAQKKMVALTLKYREDYRRRIGRAIQRGVKVGLGSDFVGFPPAYCAREFAQLVEVGMTPMQAIKAGTIVNAELLGVESERGSIRVGMLADLVAVPGNPLEDLSELERVTFVMIGGKIVKSPVPNDDSR